MKQNNIVANIMLLWRYLGKTRRLQFCLLFLLMMLSALTEIISIGAVVPFLSALTAPIKLMEMNWFQPVVGILEIQSSDDLLLPLTIGFILAAVFAASIRILLLWVNTYLAASMGIQLREDVYARALYQPYTFHIEHNSSQLISIVTEKVGAAIGAGILHVLMFITALVTGFAIITTLLLVNPFVALVAFLVLGGGYVIIGYLTRKQIRNNGDIIAENQPEAVRCMQEGLGGIRDIIIDNSQNLFIRSYSTVATAIQLASMRNSFLSALPKSLLEMIGIILIATLAYYLQTKGQAALPVLGALALGSQRLLPSLQQIYFSWSTINGTQAILADVLTYLEQPTPSKDLDESVIPLVFNNNIVLDNISFTYRDSDVKVLETININIPKGSRIGFIGSTGSGKSTLLDVLMGLLSPSKGSLLVDGVRVDAQNIRNWQANLAHVPQSIFLSDVSMAENIAFGIPSEQIDFAKVKKAAKQANIDTFIENLPNGYKTSVGERGVQLSGGQRQRIGIARALYKESNVIIFDEATSALDDATERNVMEAINLLDDNLTLLIIAHRLSTLKGCDVIYRLDKGSVLEFGSYEQMITNEMKGY